TSGDGTKPDLLEAIGNAENGWDLLNRTDPEARELTRQRKDYKSIGTEEQQNASEAYNHLVFGFVTRPVTVDGVTYSPSEIMEMSPEQRKAMGQAFLQQYGLLDDVQDLWDQQGAFRSKEENREFATYDTWAD